MPIIEPFDALALSLHHNPGVYALLVGSGLSRAAGIPTGWEITLDLIKRLGAAQGITNEANWETWFQAKYQKAPSYSEVLDALGASAAERRSILHGYIEPKNEDDARRPTKAHRSIAKLVRDGTIRVIVTTNFDRLLENALRDEGVEPTVIASDDAVVGATPLVHSKCTVIKLHGDYLDARIKNTDAELSSYAEPIDQLLDGVFDHFGLVVVGWSGEWDKALRAAILRAPTRRYACYWAARSAPAQLAKDIITQRAGRVVQITDADAFFSRLSDALGALRTVERPHPDSVALAVALAKKYCRDDSYAMEWTELLAGEIEKIRSFVNGPDYIPRQPNETDNLNALVQQFVSRSEILRRVLLIAGRWGTSQAIQAANRAISILASWPPTGGITLWIDLRSFAATLCFYSMLIALLARENYEGARLLMHSKAKTPDLELELLSLLPPTKVVNDGNVWKHLKGYKTKAHAGSEFLLNLFKLECPLITLTDDETEDLFDRLEFLITLEFAHFRLTTPNVHFWTPVGPYLRRRGSLPRQLAWFEASAHPLIKAGLLGGDSAKARHVVDAVNEHLKKIPNY
jgi:SIR2-like domain